MLSGDESWKSYLKFAVGLSVFTGVVTSLVMGMVLGPATLKLIITVAIFVFVLMVVSRGIVDGVQCVYRRITSSSSG